MESSEKEITELSVFRLPRSGGGTCGYQRGGKAAPQFRDEALEASPSGAFLHQPVQGQGRLQLRASALMRDKLNASGGWELQLLGKHFTLKGTASANRIGTRRLNTFAPIFVVNSGGSAGYLFCN